MLESGKAEDWRPDFSQVLQRTFCCAHGNPSWCLKSDSRPSHRYAYDCGVDQVDYREKWVMSKKLYCCLHWDIGCTTFSEVCPEHVMPTSTEAVTIPTTSTTTSTTAATTTTSSTITSDPQSCRTDIANWQNAWPVEKKKKCCKEFLTFNVWPEDTEKECCGNGGFVDCGENYNPDYDCEAAYPNWRTAWSAAKQEWCCDHYKRGCQELPSTGSQSEGAASFDCSLDAQNSSTEWYEWSQEKKRWCCRSKEVGCHNLLVEAGLAGKYTRSSASDSTTSPASALARTWLVGVVVLAFVALGVRTLCRRHAAHLPLANQVMLLNNDVELE